MIPDTESSYSQPDRTESPVISAPACQVCGRQDETLRLVSFPFVISIVLMTFRRSFSGIWCRRHANLRWFLAAAITSVFGWIGIPFGFVYTPLALLRLVQGGNQPEEENLRLMLRLALEKEREGDLPGARRCLETCLRWTDDAQIKDKLVRLSGSSILNEPASHEKGLYTQPLAVLAMLAGSLALGFLVGGVDFLFSWILGPLISAGSSIFAAIASWTPLVLLGILSLMVMRGLFERILIYAGITQSIQAACLGILAGCVAIYGIVDSKAAGAFLMSVSQIPGFLSTSDALLNTGAVVTRGGLWTVKSSLQFGSLADMIYLILVSGLGILSLYTLQTLATQLARWRTRLASSSSGLSPSDNQPTIMAWGAMAIGFAAITLAIIVFPQKSTVDYLEASDYNAAALNAMSTGKPEEAARNLEQAVALRPDQQIYHSNLGWAYLYGNSLDRAQAEFELAIEQNPGDPITHLGLGWVYYRTSQYDLALQAFQQAQKINPQFAEAFEGSGSVYFSQEKYRLSVSSFQEALKLNPQSISGREGLGRAYLYQGDLDNAEKELQAVLQEDANNSSGMFDLALTYLGKAEYEKTVQQLKKVMEIEPDLGAIHSLLAVAYYNLDQMDMMSKELEKAQSLSSKDPASWYTLSMAYSQTQQFAAAEANLREAMKQAEVSQSYYTALAQILSARGKFDEALKACDTAIQGEPESADNYLTRSSIYIDMQNLDRALEDLHKAEELDPENRDIHSTHSFILFQQDSYQLAYQEAEQAVHENPYNASSYINLAFALRALGQFDQAKEAAQKAVKLSPKNDRAHFILGMTYFDMGDKANAADELRKFLDFYWERAYILEYKAQAEAVLKELP